MKDGFDWSEHTGREIQEFIADQIQCAVFWLRLIFFVVTIGLCVIVALTSWFETGLIRRLL